MNITDNPLLARLRTEAVAVFLDDVVAVTRAGGRHLVNGLEVLDAPPVYTGPARLVSQGSRSEAVEFPFGAFTPKDGDVVTWIQTDNSTLTLSSRVLKVQGQASEGGVMRIPVEGARNGLA